MSSLVIANWKCNPATLKEAKRLYNLLEKGIKNIRNVDIVICPPFIYISDLAEYKGIKKNVQIGGQDCFWEEKGAFTGEISPGMLRSIGCVYVIVGHSERRQYFNETEEMINRKIKAALKAELKPILCVGENKNEREAGNVFDVLKHQIQYGLKGVSEKDVKNIVIAYEPVWAIGTGNFCEADKAKKVLFFLRKILKTKCFLYGGSVNSQNAKDYIKEAGFEGLLVGGASLKPEEFLRIITSID